MRNNVGDPNAGMPTLAAKLISEAFTGSVIGIFTAVSTAAIFVLNADCNS